MLLTHLIVAKHCVFPVAIAYSLCVIVFYCADEPTKPVALMDFLYQDYLNR